jgi:hypothetical protein
MHGDAVMDCDIDPASLRCRVCGAAVSAPHVRRNCGTPPAMPAAGLGDYVAAALSAIGVTKERVEAVVGGPCGCDGRQAAMNAAGAKWLGLPPGSTAPAEIDPGTP